MVAAFPEETAQTPRRRQLRRALGLVRRRADEPRSPVHAKKSRHYTHVCPRGECQPSPRSPSRLSSSSLSSSASSSSSSSSRSTDKSSTISLSRKGVTYDVDGAVVCCRFCDILRDRDADFMYEDELVAVFRPLAPAADSHVLVVPRCHIRNINKLTAQDADLLKHMREVAQLVLRSETDATDSDCKFAFHTPPFNSIDHVHMHAFRVTSGRSFGCLGSIKYRTDTWWCQSFDVVLSRVASRPSKMTSIGSFADSNRLHAMGGAAVSTT